MDEEKSGIMTPPEGAAEGMDGAFDEEWGAGMPETEDGAAETWAEPEDGGDADGEDAFPEGEETPEAPAPESFDAFARAHPDLRAEDIPDEVWARVAGGESLEAAWAISENERLRRRVAELEQQEKNRLRSAGSRRSAGKTRAADPFDLGWEEI